MEYEKFPISRPQEREITTPIEGIPPYAEEIQAQVTTMFPEQEHAIRSVVEEITEQGHANRKIFRSQEFPGVSLPYTIIKPTEELVEKIAELNTASAPKKERETSPSDSTSQVLQDKREKKYTLLLPGSAPPSDSHEFSTIDMAVHTMIMSLPQVSEAKSQKKPIPDLHIIMPGMPDALGGHVTADFFKQVDKKGFTTYGKLYAELLQEILPTQTDEDNNAHILLHGVSQGAIIANAMLKYLPDSIRTKTQSLLDNPAGSHTPSTIHSTIKGGQILAGLMGEIGVRTFKDELTKGINGKAAAFRNYLRERHLIDPDSKSQTALKYLTAASKGMWLIHGSPLDTKENRLFIREGMKDPLTTGLSRVMRVHNAMVEAATKGRTSIQLAAKNRDRSFTSVTEHGNHIWIYQHPEKWNKRFTFVQHKLNPNRYPDAE